MPYQNDLATLAQVVSPVDAAVQAGIQNSQANEAGSLENQKAAAALPYVGPKAAADVANTQATTASTQATTQGTNLKNLFTQQTQPGEIAATNAGSQVKVTQAHLDSVNQLGQLAGSVASTMDNVPAPARAAAMAQLLQQQGVNVEQLKGTALEPLLSGDPDMLRQFSQQAIQSSASFQTQMALEEKKAQTQENVANTQGTAHVQAAQASADARRYAADQKRVIDQLKQTTDQAVAQLTSRIGTPQEQPGDKERLQFLADQQRQVHQLAAQNTQQLLQMQTNAPTLNIGSGTPAPSGGGQPAAVGGPALGEAAKASFGAYEPDKFDYRVGPNGNLQRKPK